MATAAMLLVAVGGCGGGPKMYPVSGQVLANGKPVAGAAVLFFREKGARPPSGTTNANGEFHFSAPAGQYTAVITACESMSSQVGMGVAEEDPNKVKWIVPQKYSRAEDSDLKATVQAGENQFKFEFPRK
jgi:hypothetical protein